MKGIISLLGVLVLFGAAFVLGENYVNNQRNQSRGPGFILAADSLVYVQGVKDLVPNQI